MKSMYLSAHWEALSRRRLGAEDHGEKAELAEDMAVEEAYSDRRLDWFWRMSETVRE